MRWIISTPNTFQSQLWREDAHNARSFASRLITKVLHDISTLKSGRAAAATAALFNGARYLSTELSNATNISLTLLHWP